MSNELEFLKQKVDLLMETSKAHMKDSEENHKMLRFLMNEVRDMKAIIEVLKEDIIELKKS